MKKFSRFLIRKLKDLGESALIKSMVILLCLLLVTFMAIPGVFIAFLISGLKPESLLFGGLISLLAFCFVWIIIDKTKKLIKEYKSFNEEEDEEC